LEDGKNLKIPGFEIAKGANLERPFALNMISCVGTETVDFYQPLHLVDKVEVYMQQVIKYMN
jgi:hypothetical protein